MADILHDFFVKAPAAKVFDKIATPAGLDQWWTKSCSGEPQAGATYDLGFGPEYQWKAVVTKFQPAEEFELAMSKSDSDWRESKLTFKIEDKPGGCQVRFSHKGWPESNEHYRISSYCWAMYLRLLKLNAENGLFVPYDDRLEV